MANVRRGVGDTFAAPPRDHRVRRPRLGFYHDAVTVKPPEAPDALIDDVKKGDVPKRSGINVRACEVPWAVVDIDIGASACRQPKVPTRAAASASTGPT